MKKNRLFLLIAILLILSSNCFASTQAVDNGVAYLYSIQATDGSWFGNITNDYDTTAEVLKTLLQLGDTGNEYLAGSDWIASQSTEDTDFLLRRIILLDYPSDLQFLLSNRNQDGGWGSYPGYASSTTIDSALALQALKSAGYSDQTIINGVLIDLLSAQNSDGGWGYCASASAGCGDGEGDSNVYMTALVSSTLQQFPQTTSIATAIGKATAYLISHQNTDGGFGSSPSTVYETSLAYIALVGVITDNTVLGNAINYLTTTQLSDGSWAEDPYSTALAVRALYFSENKPTPPQSSTTGTVTGTVVDATINQPLAGVSVVSGQLSVTTSSAGDFTLANIPAGSQKVTLSLSGYTTYALTINITAGSTISIGKIPMSTTPNTGIIRGTATDASNGQPLADVTITVTGSVNASATTGADGSFAFANVVPGTVTVTASKAGYYTITGSGTVSAGGILTFNPVMSTTTPPQTTVTITGKVTDASTGNPIAGATVAIAGANMSAQTAADGTYTISGINLLDFSIVASATGYDSFSYGFSATTYGTYIFNFSLNKSLAGDFQILSLSTDSQAYSTNEDVGITASIENTVNTQENALVLAKVMNEDGDVVAIVFPTEPTITLGPGETGQKTLTWNTAQFSPGNYRIMLNLTDPATVSQQNPTGTLIAEQETDVSIFPKAEISGAISLTPPAAQANMQTPIAVTAAIRNTGNMPVTGSVILEATFNGSVVYQQELPLAGMDVNNVQELDFGTFTPTDGGDCTITLRSTDPSVASNILSMLYVGPYASATFTVSPQKALTGDAKVTGKIVLKGVGNSTGQTQDPLVPLIKNAIQKGVNWEQLNAVNWQNSHNCFGCHVQTQTLIGLELSRDKVVVDDTRSQQLLNYMKSCQATNGVEGYYPGGVDLSYPIEKTSLFAWSLAYFHDSTQIQSNLTKADDYLITRQNASGYWVSDYYYGSNDWWNDLGSGQPSTPFTAYNIISLAKSYKLSSLQKYKDSMLKAVNYLKGADHTRSIITAAHIIIGLEAAYPYIDDPNLQSAVNSKVNVTITYIRSKQNTDGGWGRYAGNTSDPLPTAHVLYAMSAAGVQGNDQNLRNGATYLLNKQNVDGTWATVFNRAYTYPDRYFGVTTWAVISLPIALDTIAGVAADLTVTLPSDIAADSFSINPDSATISGGDTTYTWNFKGLTEDAKELDLDLTIKGLQLGEQRYVAKETDISFKNSYTGDTVSLPVDIPSVTGIAGVSVKTSTDKPQYNANEDVKIAATLTNNSTALQSPLVQVFVEDENGNVVAQVASFTADNLEPTVLPGWTYRIPTSFTAARDLKNKIAGANPDFGSILSGMGIQGKTIDPNSIRVIEVDAVNDVIGEKQARAVFQGNTAEVTWFMDGLTPNGATRYFDIYFDTTDHGPKDPPVNTNVPQTGSLIAYSDDTGRIYVSESYRNGTFGVPQYVDDPTGNNDNTRGIALDDFNGDGYPDIVTGSGYTGKIYYYQNKADGTNTFLPKVEIGSISAASYIMGMTVGDFNDDGRKDFVVSGNNTALYLFKGNGNGTFTQTTLPAPAGTTYLRGKAAADFNGDGKLDFITANTPNGGVYLYKGNGDGTFASPVQIGAVGTDPYGVVAGDFDEDGKIDIIENVGSSGDAYLYAGNGDETFAVPYVISPNTANYAAFATGDFNNDGHLDLMAVTYSSRTVQFYPGRGNGTFGPKVPVTTTANNVLGISSSPAYPEVWPVAGTPEPVPVQTFNFTWNTGTTPSGNYQVHVTVDDGQGIISEDYAQFTILPDIRVSSKVVTDKLFYNADEPVTITSTPTSQSLNSQITNLNAVIIVSDSSGRTVLTETKPIALLLQGQTTELNTYWNTASNLAGTYNVTLQVLSGSTVLSTSVTTFQVLGTSQTGSGLAGTLAASPSPVYQGKDETFTYGITNSGNENLPELDVTILIVDPDTQEIMKTIDMQQSAAMGITISGVQTSSTTSLSPKTYLAILQAKTPEMAAPKTLASAPFEVKPGLEVTKTIAGISRVLVWLDYQWQSGQNCPDRALIEKALNEAGVSYRIVLDKADFQTELRNPYYTDFLILGNQNPIEDHFSEELREQVYSGKGLISALFERQNLDGDVFGMTFSGDLPGSAYTIELSGSEIAASGSFLSSGSAVKIDALDPASVAGWIVETTKKGTNRYPGIIERQYGQGKVLYYAFDLGVSTGNYSSFAELLKNSLSYIHRPIDQTFQPGRFVPVEINVKSLGSAFDLRITEQYPPELRLYDPLAGQWMTDNPWTIDAHIGPDETETVLYYAFTPDKAGTFTTQTEIGYMDSGSYTFYKSLSTDIVVDKDVATMTGDILGTLNALTLSGQDKAKGDNAIRYIQNVQSRTITTANDVEMNISDLLNAVDSLLFITGSDTSDIRLTIDSLIETWEERAYYP